MRVRIPPRAQMIEKISLIFILVFILSFLFFLIKQPLLISYILSGFFSTKIFNLDSETFKILNLFSEIAIVLLLFLVGLSLKLDSFKDVFKISLILGILQEVITTILGFFVLKFLGFEDKLAFILSLAFSFSSTAIVMKIFSEKRILSTLYGKITTGFMIVQDIIAALSFILLPLLININFETNLYLIFYGILLLIILFLIVPKIIVKIEKLLEKSLEILFIFGITFAFGISFLFLKFNFPIELGAFFAGLLISRANFATEIISKLSGLRDFFLILFFVYIGSFFNLVYFKDILLSSIITSLFVLIFNPIIVLLILKLFSLPKRVSFITALTAGQISEFSFILINLLVKQNFFQDQILKDKILSFVSLVGFITIFISSYFIYFHEKIYSKVKKFLFFKEKEIEIKKDYDIFLFGCDRIGCIIKDKLKELNLNFLVIDYNPNIIEKLKKENIDSVYGDGKDIDFLYLLNFKNAKLVISTIPDFEANSLILKYCKNQNEKIKFISVAYNLKEIEKLKSLGADFIFWPHLLGGKYIAEILEKNKNNLENLKF